MSPKTDPSFNRFGKVRSLYDPECSGFYAGQSSRSNSELMNAIDTGYVELVGPTRPVAFTATNGPPVPGAHAPHEHGPHVHEYWWTVCLLGYQPDWSGRLDENDAVVVQIIFHEGASRYSIREVAATLKQVPPYRPEQKTAGQEIQDWLDLLRPLVETTGKVAQLSGLVLPGKIISAVSEMKFNSIPVSSFPWFVKTFSSGPESGIEWHIPRSLIFCTGNRLEGSLGVSFLDCEGSEAEQGDELVLEIRAFVRSRDGEELFISPTNRATQLTLRPVSP